MTYSQPNFNKIGCKSAEVTKITNLKHCDIENVYYSKTVPQIPWAAAAGGFHNWTQEEVFPTNHTTSLRDTCFDLFVPKQGAMGNDVSSEYTFIPFSVIDCI